MRLTFHIEAGALSGLEIEASEQEAAAAFYLTSSVLETFNRVEVIQPALVVHDTLGRGTLARAGRGSTPSSAQQ